MAYLGAGASYSLPSRIDTRTIGPTKGSSPGSVVIASEESSQVPYWEDILGPSPYVPNDLQPAKTTVARRRTQEEARAGVAAKPLRSATMGRRLAKPVAAAPRGQGMFGWVLLAGAAALVWLAWKKK